MATAQDIISKILVVDDEKLIRLTISAKLKRVGYVPISAGTVEDALAILRQERKSLRAVITDIMMGDMDGFVFRDIIRGIDPTLPIFFMTALDPEEGSGFLKRILDDANSYYLPKAIKPQVMLRRIQSIVASRRIEQFIERQMNEQKSSLALAANVQHSMLPVRVIMTPLGFYSTLWKPKDIVSGDLYEAMQFGQGVYLYVLGDIQGHGTSAALAMTAVQSFLKQFLKHEGKQTIGPEEIANMLQHFFRRHLADVTYMTALIAIHRPLKSEVEWITCGAPSLMVFDPADKTVRDVNPEKRGGLPVGMMPDTVYHHSDVVHTKLSDDAVCVMVSDGFFDLGRDSRFTETMPEQLLQNTCHDLISAARFDGSIASVPQKLISVFEDFGYKYCADDVTMVMFGKRGFPKDIYETTVLLQPDDIAEAAVAVGEWCAKEGWNDGLVNRVQLVMEEALMNVHDHGVDSRERLSAVANLRLRRIRDIAELTIWDCGTPTPSVEVAAGDSKIAFELKNREFSGRGRGRLITRELCNGISRSRYENLNETIYYIPVEYTNKEDGQ